MGSGITTHKWVPKNVDPRLGALQEGVVAGARCIGGRHYPAGEPIADLKNIVLKQQRLIGVKHGGGELRYVAPLKQIGENSGNLTRVSEWGPSWS